MGLETKHVIPGAHGKTFMVNIENEEDFEKVNHSLMKLEGIKDVIFNSRVYPHELTIHTSKLITVEKVQSVIIREGFHAVPKTLFSL